MQLQADIWIFSVFINAQHFFYTYYFYDGILLQLTYIIIHYLVIY